ncbi:MAG: SGNH/GDSL hydrolase family protein [Lysobacterales bacterium]
MITLVLYCLMTVADSKNDSTAEHKRGLLALGDSYTVGEGLAANESWPYQLQAALRQSGTLPADTAPPTVIAQTGWTTNELIEGIERRQHSVAPPADCYSLVTLSIGVNDQYRGRPVEQFEQGFSRLLNTAITLAGDDPSRVLVVSIPDWGPSPFALSAGADRRRVAKDIDLYNGRKRALAIERGVTFINITDATREAPMTAYAADGLHPGPAIYADWVNRLIDSATTILSLPAGCTAA